MVQREHPLISSAQALNNRDQPVSSPLQEVPEDNVSSTDEEGDVLPPIETVECEGCGRRFVGDYCPDCGQEVRASPSVNSVVEDFTRELFDIERGFLQSVKALTFYPSHALRAFLNGDRTGLMSPGRYLLAATVVNFGVYWGLGKIGLLRPFGQSPSGRSIRTTGELQEAFQALFKHQETQVLNGLIVACLLALVIGRLFNRQVSSGAKAAAIGSYLTGHTLLLEAGAAPALAAGQVLQSRAPTEPSPYLHLAISVVYIWVALHGIFGRTAWAGLKATAAIFWTVAEYWVVSMVAFSGWVLWITSRGTVDVPTMKITGITASGFLALVLLLMHAGTETYLRQR